MTTYHSGEGLAAGDMGLDGDTGLGLAYRLTVDLRSRNAGKQIALVVDHDSYRFMFDKLSQTPPEFIFSVQDLNARMCGARFDSLVTYHLTDTEHSYAGGRLKAGGTVVGVGPLKK